MIGVKIDKTKVKIIKSMRDYPINYTKIARLAGITKPTVQKQLEEMERMGIVNITHQGVENLVQITDYGINLRSELWSLQ